MEEDFGASLLPKSPLNRALSTMTLQIDGMRCTALVDTGCTQTLIRKVCCQVWERKEVHVVTVDGNILKCCGIGMVRLGPLSM